MSKKKRKVQKWTWEGLVNLACKDWPWYKEEFITKVCDGCYTLRLKNTAHDEEFAFRVATEHSNVILSQVLGVSKERDRERTLGYCLVYSGNPIVHDYTWYTGVFYSPPLEIKQKEWEIIYDDNLIRLSRAGIGVFDYLLTYRKKSTEHDMVGLSDGSVHLYTADSWKDGI